jgi:simple sugar transport system ATP-binding protein
MRQGETVARTPTRDTTPAALARAMVGRDVALAGATAAVVGAVEPDSIPFNPAGTTQMRAIPRDGTPASGGIPAMKPGMPALVVRELVVPGPRNARAVDGVSFSVVGGEILGIAGVEGNGQTELIEALAGLRAPTGGSIHLGNRDITSTSVRERLDNGMSHVPEDRHRRGLILDYSIADNLILGAQHHYARRGVLDRQRVGANASERVAAFDIRPPDPALPARALSGGNQQKIVIAREMKRAFSVLLAAQPTRGVDVGAIEQIHDRLRAARAEGKAIVLVSAELSEVLALSDRIAVMYGGRFAAVMSRTEATEEILGQYMTGAAGAGGATPSRGTTA